MTPSQPQVLLAIPGYRMQFCAAAGAADRVIAEAIQAQVLAEVTRPIGMNIHQARNAVFHDASKSQGITHVFFLDDDVVPPPGVISTLLAAHVGVIGGCYPLRIDGQKKCAAWDWGSHGAAELFSWRYEQHDDEDGLHPELVYPRVEPYNGHTYGQDLQVVGGVGTGCMLIQIGVVRHMLKIYKTPFQSPDEADDAGNITNVSDDVYFANRLREQGIPVLLNKTVICKHYGIVEFSEMVEGDDQ